MRETSYARGANAVIYRTKRGETPATVAIASTWNSNGFKREGTECSNLGGPTVDDAIEAIPALDLSHLVSRLCSCQPLCRCQ